MKHDVWILLRTGHLKLSVVNYKGLLKFTNSNHPLQMRFYLFYGEIFHFKLDFESFPYCWNKDAVSARGKHFILLNIKQVKYEFLKEVSSKKSNQWIKFSFNIDALCHQKYLHTKLLWYMFKMYYFAYWLYLFSKKMIKKFNINVKYIISVPCNRNIILKTKWIYF